MKNFGDNDISCIEKYKVYKYTFPSGMIYIGVTKNSVKERRNQGYNHNKKLKNALAEVGFKNIDVDILEYNLSKEEAYEKEKYYIKYFNSADKLYGYNQSTGGKSGFEGLHHTETHKNYISNLYKGINFSEKHLENLRKGHEKERKPVKCEMKDGTFLMYDSMRDAANDVGGYASNIGKACISGKYYKNRKWFFTERSDEK